MLLWRLQLLHTSMAGVGKELGDHRAEVFLVQTQLRGGGKGRSLVRGSRNICALSGDGLGSGALRSTQRSTPNAGGLEVRRGSAVLLGLEVFIMNLESTKA